MAVVTAGGLWRFRPLRRVEVSGDSMRPTLEPGDRLLAVRAMPLRIGDVVAVGDPGRPGRTIVKRVAARGPEGLTVLGDNPLASTDSRSFGPVRPGSVHGRVLYRYFPDSRRGLLYPQGHVERRGRPGPAGRLPR